MSELVRVSEHCHYLEGPAKVGVVELGGGEVCLIDSGLGRRTADALLRILHKRHWRLSAIYNTHSHIDHTSNDRRLQEATGCRVYAPGIECLFVRNPGCEPPFLYGGFPPRALVEGYGLPGGCDCEPLAPEVLPDGLEMIPLPGHYLEMVGFRAPEGVVYLADCLVSEATLAKGNATFVYDVAASLETLGRVREMEAALFVPAHAEPTTDIRPLVDANVRSVHAVCDLICETCATPRTTDEVTAAIFHTYGLRMTLKQYVVVGSTVRSYLAYLSDVGRLAILCEGDRLLWAQRG